MPLKDLAKQQFGPNRVKALSTKKGLRTPQLTDKHAGTSFTFTPKATDERANKQVLHLLNQKVRASIKPETTSWWEVRSAKGLVQQALPLTRYKCRFVLQLCAVLS